jgi:hypothetical protein
MLVSRSEFFSSLLLRIYVVVVVSSFLGARARPELQYILPGWISGENFHCLGSIKFLALDAGLDAYRSVVISALGG